MSICMREPEFNQPISIGNCSMLHFLVFSSFKIIFIIEFFLDNFGTKNRTTNSVSVDHGDRSDKNTTFWKTTGWCGYKNNRLNSKIGWQTAEILLPQRSRRTFSLELTKSLEYILDLSNIFSSQNTYSTQAKCDKFGYIRFCFRNINNGWMIW